MITLRAPLATPLLQLLLLLAVAGSILGQDIVFNLTEEVALGTSVGTIRDPSAGQTPDIRYTFLTSGYEDSVLFNLDVNGVLTTNDRLDREELCDNSVTCVLKLQVAAQSQTGYFKKLLVDVNLLDINDNAPRFADATRTLEVSEATAVNTTFSLPTATDADVGQNSVVAYLILNNPPGWALVHTTAVDNTSRLSLQVRAPLDRETTPWQRLVITAEDGGPNAHTATLTVNVTILDVNDNDPVFEKSLYNITIRETTSVGTVILRVVATDADTAPNGVQAYGMSPMVDLITRSYFAVNNRTGEISVAGSLLQAQGNTFTFVVECADGGRPIRMAQTQVVIRVEDTSNSAPQLHVNLLANGDVSENAPIGTVVAVVTANDPDAGVNGEVNCASVSDVFQLQRITALEFKVVVTSPLDRELEDSHTVQIGCQDGGTPPLSATATVTIHVMDENDHTPQFTKSLYRGDVEENSAPNTRVLQVTATDADIGMNGNVTYFIYEDVGLGVSPNGEIFTTRRLDREMTVNITVRVWAQDMGIPSRNSSCLVSVTILDTNDNAPVFSNSSYIFSVPENQGAGTVIGVIRVTDADEGTNAELVLNLDVLFEDLDNFPLVLSRDGTLTTRDPLDREARPQYDFNVVATDKGNPPQSTTVRVVVKVTDMNDHVPEITSPSQANSSIAIQQSILPSVPIFTFSASDQDVGENARVVFNVTAQTHPGTFRVNPNTGVLSVARELLDDDVGSHAVTVEAADQGRPSLKSNKTLTVVVYYVNMTVNDRPTVGPPGSQNGEGGGDNTLTVLILGCVTGFITIIIIIIIVVIKTADRHRKRAPRRPCAGGDIDADFKPGADSAVDSIEGFVIGHDVSLCSSGITQDHLPNHHHHDHNHHNHHSNHHSPASKYLPSIDESGRGSSVPESELSGPVPTNRHLLLKTYALNPNGKGVGETSSQTSAEASGTDSGRGGSDDGSHSNGRMSPHDVSSWTRGRPPSASSNPSGQIYLDPRSLGFGESMGPPLPSRRNITPSPNHHPHSRGTTPSPCGPLPPCRSTPSPSQHLQYRGHTPAPCGPPPPRRTTPSPSAQQQLRDAMSQPNPGGYVTLSFQMPSRFNQLQQPPSPAPDHDPRDVSMCATSSGEDDDSDEGSTTEGEMVVNHDYPLEEEEEDAYSEDDRHTRDNRSPGIISFRMSSFKGPADKPNGRPVKFDLNVQQVDDIYV